MVIMVSWQEKSYIFPSPKEELRTPIKRFISISSQRIRMICFDLSCESIQALSSRKSPQKLLIPFNEFEAISSARNALFVCLFAESKCADRTVVALICAIHNLNQFDFSFVIGQHPLVEPVALGRPLVCSLSSGIPLAFPLCSARTKLW